MERETTGLNLGPELARRQVRQDITCFRNAFLREQDFGLEQLELEKPCRGALLTTRAKAFFRLLQGELQLTAALCPFSGTIQLLWRFDATAANENCCLN